MRSKASAKTKIENEGARVAETIEPRISKAKQKELTRQRILQAVLDIAVSDGMRAVRHRAVAEKAGVALGTTTYHFNSIEDLIISAFQYWRGSVKLADNPYYNELTSLLAPYEMSGVPEAKRQVIAANVFKISLGYLTDQITHKKRDRIVELAFYHESMHYNALQDEMRETWGLELEYLQQVHRIMGSAQPQDDARITFTLFRQLEQASILSGSITLDEDVLKNTLYRHMSLCFGLTFKTPSM